MKQFTFNLGNFLDTIQYVIRYCQRLDPKKTYDIDIKEHRGRRTLDANAYCWALMSKMAEVLHTSKEEVYLEMLRRYGQQFVVKVPIKAVEMFRRQYKYCEEHEKLPEEERAQYFRVFLGSSNYDIHEMSILIDGIVSECKDMDIETQTPEQLAILKRDWGRLDG